MMLNTKVGVIRNLVHSSPNIKKEVLQAGALQPVIRLLRFKAYVGVPLLKTAFDGVVSEWQVIICRILLIVMALGNSVNTVQALLSKSRFKAKMKKRNGKD